MLFHPRPAEAALTCAGFRGVSCPEMLLLLLWLSPGRSSSPPVSQHLWGPSENYPRCPLPQNLPEDDGRCQAPRSLFQSLMRTFAKAMTSSSVQCFLMLFTETPILVS